MVFGLTKPRRPATEWRDIAVGGGRVHPVRIQRRRNARRMTMRVRDRAVHLTVPPGARDSEIEGFVAQHGGWIDDQFRQFENAIAESIPGIEGPAIFHLGVPKQVFLACDARHRGRGRVEEEPRGLVIRVSASSRVRPARVLEGWLKEGARAAIAAELADVLPRLGEEPCPVTIRDQKTRWGSCSATRRLSFNWRLAMAPPACLRYLVIHEAAHLVHLDHSPSFWAVVEGLMPDYRLHQQWLREHQTALFADIGERLAGLETEPGQLAGPGPATRPVTEPERDPASDDGRGTGESVRERQAELFR